MLSKIFRQKLNNKDMIFWAVALLFFVGVFFFLGQQEPVFMNDSLSYVNASHQREPVYPLIIRLCMLIGGGQEFGLWILVIMQGLVAMFACMRLLYVLRKRFALPLFVSFGTCLLLLLPFWLDSFFSDGATYTHMILTECFSYALFYFYIAELMEFLWTRKRARFVWMLVIAFVMSLLRSQLVVLHGVSAIAALLEFVWSKKDIERSARVQTICIRLAGIIILYVVSVLGICFYSLVSYGSFEASSENSFTSVTNLLYLGEAEDAEAIEDIQVRELYQEIYAQMQVREYGIEYASGHAISYPVSEEVLAQMENGLFYYDTGMDGINAGKYKEVCHDPIKYVVLRPCLSAYVSRLGYDEGDFAADKIKREALEEIKRVLTKNHFGEWILNSMATWPTGLSLCVMPVFYPQMDVLMCVIGCLIWGIVIAGFVFLFASKERRVKYRFELACIFCIGAFIVVNAVGVSMVIFYVTRYINYTQGLFWVLAFVEARCVWWEIFARKMMKR